MIIFQMHDDAWDISSRFYSVMFVKGFLFILVGSFSTMICLFCEATNFGGITTVNQADCTHINKKYLQMS